MFKNNKASKILFYLTHALAFAVLALLFTHMYMGDRHYDSGRNYFPPASQFLHQDETEFTVAVMGDSTTNNLVLEKLIQDARGSDENFSFIMYLGDLVMDRSRTNFYWMLWEIKPYLGDFPFYAIPGNHDVAKRDGVDKSYYRSVMGPTYYWFGHGDTLFINMDSSGDFIEDEQFAWLSDTLTKIRPLFRHCVLFGHRPPKNPIGKSDHKMDAVSIEKFKSIVGKHKSKIDAMIFGHVHYFSADEFIGIPIYTVPSGGQYFGDDLKKYGYVSLTIGKNGVKSIQPKYIDFTGRISEQTEAWLVSNILSQKLRKMVTIFLIIAGVFLGISAGIGYIKRKKS